MKKGDRGTFRASCGTDVTGEIIEVTDVGYTVRGDNVTSDQHEDGLFRFTFQ